MEKPLTANGWWLFFYFLDKNANWKMQSANSKMQIEKCKLKMQIGKWFLVDSQRWASSREDDQSPNNNLDH